MSQPVHIVNLNTAGAPTARLRAKFGERVIAWAVGQGAVMNDRASCCGDAATIVIRPVGDGIQLDATATFTDNGEAADYHSDIYRVTLSRDSSAKAFNKAARQLATLAIEQGCERRNAKAVQRLAERQERAAWIVSHNPFTNELLPCSCDPSGKCYSCLWIAEYATEEERNAHNTAGKLLAQVDDSNHSYQDEGYDDPDHNPETQAESGLFCDQCGNALNATVIEGWYGAVFCSLGCMSANGQGEVQ